MKEPDLAARFYTLPINLTGRDAEGRPFDKDPPELAGIHRAVEASLFQNGSPPYSDLAAPGQVICRHLLDTGASSSLYFGEKVRRLTDGVLYGRAVYEAAASLVGDGSPEAMLVAVPYELRGQLFGTPVEGNCGAQRRRFRKFLRARWFGVRTEEVVPLLIAHTSDFRVDMGDFAYRAGSFLTQRIERARWEKMDYPQTALAMAAEFCRWQRILASQVKAMVNERSLSSHCN